MWWAKSGPGSGGWRGLTTHQGPSGMSRASNARFALAPVPGRYLIRLSSYAMSFSFLRARIFTRLLAGLAFISMSSPGRNGFGTFFLALWAGFLTVLIFINPGKVQYPTEPFLICRSMTVSIAANTEATSRFDKPVFSAMSAIIWDFVIAAFNLFTRAITSSCCLTLPTASCEWPATSFAVLPDRRTPLAHPRPGYTCHDDACLSGQFAGVGGAPVDSLP